MRVTNSMMNKNFLRDVNRNLNSINNLNNQLSSGRKIFKPSENPYEASKIMQIKSEIRSIEQYSTNMEDALNFLSNTDSALDRLGNAVQRVRELVVSAGNVSYGTDEFNGIKAEVNEKIKEISQVLNTTSNGMYIFGGTKTSSKPVGLRTDIDGNNHLYFSGNDGEILDFDDLTQKNQVENLSQSLSTEICKGVYSDFNLSAIDMLISNRGKENEINFIDSLNGILEGLDGKVDADKFVESALKELDQFLTNINSNRALVGTKQNRFEEALSQNEDSILNLKEAVSELENIDFVEKSIEINSMQTTYMACLQTSSYIMQKSLLDFIK